MRNFISVKDASNLDSLVKGAIEYKSNPFKDRTLGANKRIGLLFLNPSMRTRLSTQIAAQNLGMEAIVFNVGQDGWMLEFEDEAIMSGIKRRNDLGIVGNGYRSRCTSVKCFLKCDNLFFACRK